MLQGVVFKDFKAYDINKEDEKCLKAIMKIDVEDDAIYKEYLNNPTDYEFEHSLENNLYVYREKVLQDRLIIVVIIQFLIKMIK